MKKGVNLIIKREMNLTKLDKVDKSILRMFWNNMVNIAIHCNKWQDNTTNESF